MKYQPEVDGLRALAVVPVVLFHAGFSTFSGGYVGVDIFYVISGYLITGIIKSDLDQNRFSIVHFYERRVRRIIPALMLVVGACLVAGFFLFLPYQLHDLSLSAINAVTFTSNIWFWNNSGYFRDSSALVPLLHTWSLAVEEQFYLFFPVALWVLTRFRMRLVPVITAVFVGSLALAEFLVLRSPSAAFYWLPTRAWELMLGALLSLGVAPGLRAAWLRNAVTVTGLAGLLVPVFVYSSTTSFPGLAAALPCFGAACVILAGQQGGGLATRIVGSRIPVSIGLISYSLYLWHWPIFVFSRQLLLNTALPPLVAWEGIVAALALAWFTWRFVETPFRDRRRMSRHTVFAGAALMAIVVTGTALATASGLPQRFPPDVLRLASGKEDVPEQVKHCIADEATLRSCPLGYGKTPSFAVWGDSHSAALAGAVDSVARQDGLVGLLFSSSGCPPGLDGPTSPTITPADREKCHSRNRLVEDRLLQDGSIRTVILIAYWQSYLSRDADALLASVGQTLMRLRRAGKRIVVLADLPVPGFDVPWVTPMDRYYGRPLPVSGARPGADARLTAMARRMGTSVISLAPAFCQAARCQIEENDNLLFIDRNHLSKFGNHVLAPYLESKTLFDPRDQQ
ncbi:MAG TPA: acyltransferase family protein [Allosphingosinicella sp.]|jgi:peptidoglycan/LPS O-acetylase OafA/YrhL